MATRPTVGAVLDNVGSGAIRVLVAPRGLDVEVADVLIHDPLEPPAWHPGDVVLAVGVDADRRDALVLIEQAGEAGVAAIVIRMGDLPAPALLEAAEQTGVAVLAVDPEMAWGHLHGVIRSARVTAGESDPGRGPLGDLFSLANAVASMVGGPTTIEDPDSTVLAYSSSDDPIDEPRRQTILGRRVPDEWLSRLRADGVFKRLWSSDDVHRIDYSADGLKPRLAVRVRAGDEILGSIWVAEGARPFGPEAEPAMAEAARIASLHLIRARSNFDLERRRRGELLRDAIEGRVPPEIAAAALEIAKDVPIAVAAVELDSSDDGGRAALAERLVGFVALYSEAYRRRAVSTEIARRVYILAPVPDMDRRAVVALFNELVARAEEAVHAKLLAGVGATVSGLADLGHTRRDADLAVRALRVEGVRSVAGIEHVRSRAVLLRLTEVAATEHGLSEGRVAALAEHDRTKGTEYVVTLAAYLDAFGDVPLAATLMGIHPNTFRYRLRRLSEAVGLDLDDAAERLVAHLQLHWLGVAARGTAPPSDGA